MIGNVDMALIPQMQCRSRKRTSGLLLLSALERGEGFENRFREIFVVGSGKHSEFSLELTGAS